jgi:hypothetical protein
MRVNSNKIIGNSSPELINSLFIALIIPMFLGLLGRLFVNFLYYGFFFIVLIFPFYILILMVWEWIQKDKTALQALIRYVRPIPPWAIYNNELKQESFPWISIHIRIILIWQRYWKHWCIQ